MQRCEACQSQMLEYLYDVLEDVERLAFREHLDQCAVCQAVLIKAQTQQNLLAAAARLEFPEVRFQSPADPVAPLPRATVPLPYIRPIPNWRRWTAAAAIL